MVKSKRVKKRPIIAFSYDPTYATPEELGTHHFTEIYRRLFEITGSNSDNIFFNRFLGIGNDAIELLAFLIDLEGKNLIIHNSHLFAFQLLSQGIEETKIGCVEQYLNNLLLDQFAKDGRCEGLKPKQREDVKRKENLSTICNQLGIAVPDTVRATALLENSASYKKTLEKLISWRDGFYLKHGAGSNGRLNFHFQGESISDLLTMIKKANPKKIRNFIVTRRIKTPHPKYASHYRAFSFFDGKKTNILAAVLYYNLGNNYSIHGSHNGNVGAIPLTGKYRDRRKTKAEKELIKAHSLDSLELPPQAAQMVKKTGEYAARRGKLILSTEVVEGTDHKFYIIDINTTPGIVAIKAAEFPPNKQVAYKERYDKVAEMIVECYAQ